MSQRSFRVVGTALAAALLATAPTSANSTFEQARALVGTVDYQGLLYATATRSILPDLCGHSYEFEDKASPIARLQYGALTDEQRASFTQDLRATLGRLRADLAARAEAEYPVLCSRATQFMNKHLTDFMDSHPTLFDE